MAGVVRGLLWTQMDSVAETTQGGQTERIAGSDRLDGGNRRDASADLAERVLPDQHRDGRAALPSRDRVRRAGGLRSRVRPVLRDRHDRAVDGAAGRARSGGSKSSRRRSPTRSRTRALNEVDNARFFAGDVRLAMRELVERAGRPDVLVVDPPRSGLSQKIVRRVIEAGPRRIVYVSCNPTTLAPNAAQLVADGGYGCAGCARSTCSRRRRTSSAWRCWSAL